MKKKRKTWIWILIAVVIIGAIAGYVIWNSSRSEASRYAEETVRSGSIETYYSFNGNVAVRNGQSVVAKTNVIVRELYVSEDQAVRSGDPLMRLSSGEVIKADIDGEVTDIYVDPGDSVNMGAALLDVVDFADLQVIMNVDEFDVSAVTVGSTATVTIDALGLTYEGTVEYISKNVQSLAGASGVSMTASSNTGGDISYYEAKVSAPADERILPGMKVDVKILNEQASDTALLSMSALQFDAYNKPYVYTRNSRGEMIETAVSVGIQDGTTVQITEGLRVGDIVYVPQRDSMFPMFGNAR